MIVQSRLQADCARCCGLCCVAPSFDAEQGFAFDKAAHTACPHLRHDHRCGIHPALRVRGFPACASFDCHGAGQWVTQQVFGGQSWQTSPEIAARMFRLYERYRALHELMALLQLAIARVPPAQVTDLECCLQDIDAICRAGPESAVAVSMGALRDRVRQLLRASH
jgi:hypothetical protein